MREGMYAPLVLHMNNHAGLQDNFVQLQPLELLLSVLV